jgi:hypothetical protein
MTHEIRIDTSLNSRTLVLGLTLALASGAVLAQPQVSTTTIATSASTDVPVGTSPALENGMLAYYARTGNNGPNLLLAGPVSGPFQVIARDGEQVPGLPPGTVWSGLTNPDLSDGAVFFAGVAGQLFRWQSGVVTRLYDRTAFPGGAGPDLDIPQANSHAIISYKDNTPGFPTGTADVYQTIIDGPTTLLEQCRRNVVGVASARGNWFVYLPVGVTPSVAARRFLEGVREIVTDSGDVVPGVGGAFAGYQGTSTDGVRASYIGLTASGAQQAVCVTPLGMNNAGPVTPLATTGQSAPGGGAFSSFERTAIGGDVVFYKAFAGGQSGIFFNIAGTNYQIVRAGSFFQGRAIIDTSLGGAGADGSSVAFRLRYSDAALPGGFGYALLVATVTVPCYANCDGSTGTPRLTANDFQCFINKFAAQDPYANCDGSTSLPTLTANDFTCFLNSFAAGCP